MCRCFRLISPLFVMGLILGLTVTTGHEVAHAQSRIAATVNKGIITTNQISQRARFLRLTRFKGDSVAEARKQLIDEELQLQEARRLNFQIPESAVKDAFKRMANSGRLNPSQFRQVLNSRGIRSATVMDFIRSRILWQQIVFARARSETQSPSGERDITSILFNRGSEEKNRKVKEYTIEQIVFVLKRNATKAQAAQRLREIQAFKGKHNSCEAAKDAATKLASSGVIMKSLGRFTEDTLPGDIRKEVIDAGDDLYTTPRRGEIGVGMFAICKTRQIVDNSSTAQAFDVGRLGNEELQKKSEKWMSELRDIAKIEIR